MGIQGNLSTMTLPDVLQWIGHAFQSGHLTIVNAEDRRTFYLRDGHLVAVSSNSAAYNLIDVLAKRRYLSDRQIQLLKILHDKTKDDFAILIHDLELLQDDQLSGIATEVMVEMVFEVFNWDEGEFVFRKGLIEPPNRLARQVELGRIIIEGCRRLDDWQRFNGEIPSEQAVYALNGAEPFDNPDAKGSEFDAIQLVNGRRSITEIMDIGAFSPYQVYAAIYRGLKESKLKLVGEDSAYVRARSADASLELARKLLAKNELLTALDTVEKALSANPDNEEAVDLKKTIARAKNQEMLTIFRNKGLIPQISMAPGAPDFPSDKLNSSEGFILSRIDSHSDVEALTRVCGIPRPVLVETLYKFFKLKIIVFRKRK